MSVESAGAGKVVIGRVLGESFGVLRRNALAFTAPALLYSLLPSVAVGVMAAMSEDPATAEDVARLGNLPVSLLTIALQASVMAVIILERRGRALTPQTALAAAGRPYLLLLLLNIVTVLGIGAGLLLLIVPGVFLACAWAAAAPALVAENKGVFDAMRRSWDLTRNNRWPIFLIFLILSVAVILTAVILGALLAIVGGIGETPTISSAIVEAVASTVFIVISSAAAAVLYLELRALREGVGSESLAEVFS